MRLQSSFIDIVLIVVMVIIDQLLIIRQSYECYNSIVLSIQVTTLIS